MVRFIWEK